MRRISWCAAAVALLLCADTADAQIRVRGRNNTVVVNGGAAPVAAVRVAPVKVAPVVVQPVKMAYPQAIVLPSTHCTGVQTIVVR